MKTSLLVLNKHGPIKSKILRANHVPYIWNIAQSSYEKVIFGNKIFQNHSFKAYKKPKNYYSGLYKKEKKEFSINLNLLFVTDNKNFWEVVNPLFDVKGCVGGNNIVLSEKI